MLITFLASAAIFAVVTIVAMRYAKAKRRAALLSMLLPLLVQPVIFGLSLRFATCSGDDCGRLLLIAAGVVSVLVLIGGIVGAALALLGYRWRRKQA